MDVRKISLTHIKTVIKTFPNLRDLKLQTKLTILYDKIILVINTFCEHLKYIEFIKSLGLSNFKSLRVDFGKLYKSKRLHLKVTILTYLVNIALVF